MEKKSCRKYILLILLLFILGYIICPTILIILSTVLEMYGCRMDSYIVMLCPYVLSIALFSLVARAFKTGLKEELYSENGGFRSRLFFFAFLLMLLFQLSFLLIPIYQKTRNTESTSFILYSAMVALLTIPFQTLFEELLYRILPLRLIGNGKIESTKKSMLSMTLFSLLFMLMHANNPEVLRYGHILLLYYFLSGFMLGIFMLFSKGVEISWAYHLAINLYGAIIASSESGVLGNRTFFILESNHAVAQSFISLILSSALMLYLIYIGRRKNLFSL